MYDILEIVNKLVEFMRMLSKIEFCNKKKISVNV